MSTPGNYVGMALAVATTAIAFTLLRKKWSSKSLAYPPGPKGYPIVGNAFDFPGNPIWEGLTKMARDYSERTVLWKFAVGVFTYSTSVCVETDILHLNLMGRHLVLLSNTDVATQLVGRCSAMYSDRVRKPFRPLFTILRSSTPTPSLIFLWQTNCRRR